MNLTNKPESSNDGLSEARALNMVYAADALIRATEWAVGTSVTTTQTFERATPTALSVYPDVVASTAQSMNMQPALTATTNTSEVSQNPLFAMANEARERAAQIHEGIN